MSAMDFLKRILGREASPEEKIRELSAKRAETDDERKALEKGLDELIKKEEALRKEGAAAASDAVKRRLASQHAQLTQEIRLQNEKVSILNKQSQVLSRHIHNLEVAETARPTELPASEDITEAAAAAEGALEELDEAYETVRTVSSAISEQTLTDDEAASLAIFEAEAAKQKDDAAKATPDRPAKVEADEEPEATAAPEEREREAEG